MNIVNSQYYIKNERYESVKLKQYLYGNQSSIVRRECHRIDCISIQKMTRPT